MTVTANPQRAASSRTPEHGPDNQQQVGTWGSIAWAAFGFGLFAFIIFVSYNLQLDGQLTERVANPQVSGAPRPAQPLVNHSPSLPKVQVGTIVMMFVLTVLLVVMWRRYPRHPVLLCGLACTGIVWMDPIMNWAPFAVYNPQTWHLPNDWWIARLSPTVEPFVVLGYVTFCLFPFFPGLWILRRLQRRFGVHSFFQRHPLISLAVLVYII